MNHIPKTDFYSVLGYSLIDQSNDLADWTESFYKASLDKVIIKALYFEMNEFDINTDLWYITAFAFSKDGKLNLDDMEWLCDFDTDSLSETDTVFAIEGLEKSQKAFENTELINNNLQNARDWSEQIIIARFMELMRFTHLTAKDKSMEWQRFLFISRNTLMILL